jgi:cobalt/nickel transport system ATP-binding protein
VGPVIAARGLAHEYPDGTEALDGLSLTVEAGERVAVVGANGSGKSTLGAVLGGLVEPSEGTVEYFDTTTDAEAVRDRLGVLLQDPDDYLFNTTVREDIEYGPAQLGMEPDRARARVERLAADLGLTELLDRAPFRLSGGEKQRAAVASVLAFDPDVLLLDEPFGAVDARYRERIRERLDAHDGTLLLFTPSPEVVPALADRVVLVADGAVVADDDTRTVLTDTATLAECGLRPPATVRLFEGRLDEERIPLTVEAARRHLDAR